MKSQNTYIISIIVILLIVIGILVYQNKQTPSETDNVSASALTSYTKTRALENGKYVTTVSYIGKGFSPEIVSINAGEEVRFVNKSNLSMRIISNVFNNVPLYPGFDQEKSVGLNGSYPFVFTQKGVWGYHNLDNQDTSIVGIVYVK